MFKSTIYDGTVTYKDYRQVIKHKNDSNDYISVYHKMACEILQTKYVFSFGSGRGALYVILKAMGIGNGDEVIIQGYTCVAVPKAIIYTGAKPLYADISPDDYNMTLDSMKRVFSQSTKAVVIQHTYGIPCHEIDKIVEFCHEKGVLVIEDCAHTFGTEYKGRILGTIGDAAFFSTDHSKYISTCVGGLAITNDDAIAKKIKEIYEITDPLSDDEVKAIVRQLREGVIGIGKQVDDYVSSKKILRKIRWIIRDKWKFNNQKPSYWLDDYNSFEWPQYTFPGKLSNIQAHLGVLQLKSLRNNIEHRRVVSEIYDSYLSNTQKKLDVNSPLMYPICISNPNELIRELRRQTLLSRWFCDPILCISREEYKHIFFHPEDCPNADNISKEIVNLPCHMKISIAEAEIIGKTARYIMERQCIKRI